MITKDAENVSPAKKKNRKSNVCADSVKDECLDSDTNLKAAESPRCMENGSRRDCMKSWIKDALKQNVDVLKVNTPCETNVNISFFGLPDKVRELLDSCRGIAELYDWQRECLSLPEVQQGANLIYSLPTSGGKTLVAELLVFRELLCKFRNALFILPYISIVQEKVRALSTFAVELDFVVEEYAGHKGYFPPRKRTKRQTVYVATIEKAHSLVNTLIEEGRIEELGLVVVDELHMLYEEGDRGAVLETALTKLMFAARRLQIIGMSATLKHLDKLRPFLNASLYSHDFRPVELQEYVKLENKVFQVKRQNRNYELEYCRELRFKYSLPLKQRDPDFLVGLVLEVIPLESCLIFCPTKRHCENVALLLGRLLPPKAIVHKESEKAALLQTLRQENSGQICPILQRAIRCGVAYHHSGLTADERRIIEEAYLAGTLCILVSTSTLAAGVNLPAKRVIVRSPYVGTSLLTASRYKQMIGRAGRAGMTTSGESILILKENDLPQLDRVLLAAEEPFHSALENGHNLEVFLLGLVGLQLARNVEMMVQMISCSLFAASRKTEEVQVLVTNAISSLRREGLVNFNARLLNITPLGRATHKSGVGLEFGKRLYDDLQRSLKLLSLSTHLHLLYLVTPYNFEGITINPNFYFQNFFLLQEDDLQVASLVGVTESVVTRLKAGRLAKAESSVLPRFYLTLILYDLWNQQSIWQVAEKYDLHRGTIHNLLSSAAAFGSSVLHFCQELPEFWALKDLLPSFVKQLSYCVSSELIELMELPAVKRGRARQLYNAGFKTLSDVAQSKPQELAEKIEHLSRKAAHEIIATAKMLLLERAESLRDEAQEIVSAIQQ